MCAGEETGLTGGVISILMGFLSPVEGAGLLPPALSQAQTAVAASCSAQSPGRQVDLFSCVTDRWENR